MGLIRRLRSALACIGILAGIVHVSCGGGGSGGTTSPQPQPQPTINSFSATPSTINLGGSSSLSWSTTNATSVSISKIGSVAASGSTSVSPSSTDSYTLTATNTGGSVSALVTITVVPPITPPVVNTFSASPSTIAPGQSSTLTWSVSNATSATISQVGSVASSGTQAVNPSSTTTYTLTASNGGGSSTASATVTVINTPIPIINSFTASPATITAGQSSTLAWSVSNATSATISQVGSVASSGTQAVYPSSTTTYTLTASNGGGSSTASATVTVINTPIPIINSFTASPATITAGQSSTLSWSVSNATSATISQIGSVAPSGTIAVNPLSTTTYTLTATNNGGSSIATATVTVNPPTQVPIVNSFTATPSVISTGQSSTLSWSVSNSSSVNISQLGGVASSGSAQVSPSSTTTYTLTASNPSGNTTSTATVTVNPPIPHQGEVKLLSGTLAGRALSPSNWQITVTPGSAITGSVSVETNNLMGANGVAPFGYTWTWGNRSSSITQVDGWIPTGRTSWNVPIALTAPSTPGTYYILFGFNGEFNLNQVFSCTNWSYGNGSPVWNDGNDYWDMSASVLTSAASIGYAPAWAYLGGPGTLDAPVMPIKVVVQTPPVTHQGEVKLLGGNLGGQPLSPGNWQISVNAGSTITGSVSVETNNLMGANGVAPFGYTWTWGSRTSSITQVDPWIPTGRTSWNVPISLVAPSTPGTYYILFGFNGEYNLNQVFSCTNWSYGNGSPVWNDGNDYWDMNATVLTNAASTGYAPNWTYLGGPGVLDAPVCPIKIIVTGPSTLLNETFSAAGIPAGWSAVIPSAWSVVSGVLRQNQYNPETRYIMSYTGGTSWTNYRAEVDAWTTSLYDPASIELYFRFSNYDNTYIFDIHSNGNAYLHKRIAGVQTLLGMAVGANPSYLSPVRMVAEVVGSNIKIYRNTTLLFNINDTSLSSGTIAVESIHVPGYFDNVLVTSR